MKLLLDTHIWVWSQLAPERLSRKVVRALRSSKNEIWISSVTIWEFVVLVQKGRIELDDEVDRWLTNAAERAPTHEAPLTHEIALATREIELSHKDPVDRFLAATSRVLDLTLVTADERLLRGAGYTAMAND